MTDEQLTSVVLDCLHEVAGIPSAVVVPSRHLLEYGVDSILAVDLFMVLEDRFHIDIPNEVLARLTSVNEVVEYLGFRMANPCDDVESPVSGG